MSAMTLSQALTRLAAIGRTQLTELTIAQSVESDVVCLDVRLPLTPQTPGFAISETGSVVILLDLLRSFLGRTFQPKVIHLASRSQDLPYDIETAFGGVPVRVNRRSAAVFFPAAFLTSLSPVLTGAHRLDARPPGPLEAVPSKMSDRLRVLVSGLLPDGAPTVQQTAESLGVSPRTLQRRLADEGTSYFQVVDDARCATALRGLRDPDQTLDDIAYDAGYAERAPFIRAFKRWTGLTPRDYQRHHEKRPEN
jgi:AraC-like DNA-binding protein